MVLFAVWVFVVIVNVTDEAPAGTVTEVGTVATVVALLVNVTTKASGETPDNVTVPVDVSPPLTVDGDKVQVDTVRAGVTDTIAVFETVR